MFSKPKHLTQQQLLGRAHVEYDRAGVGISELAGPRPPPGPGEGTCGTAGAPLPSML